MKPLSLLLATAVFFLAIQPGMDSVLSKFASAFSCCVETCTPLATTDVVPAEQPNKGCDGTNCNPFLSCGPCSVLCQSIVWDTSESTSISSEQPTAYSFLFSSSFISDFWQPPKFV